MSTIPESFNCCITQQLMREPVQSPRGHSYERSAIEEWISIEGNSAMTRDTISISDLRPNLALKDGIDTLVRENPSLLINPTNVASHMSPETVTESRSSHMSPATVTPTVMYSEGKLLISHKVEGSDSSAPSDLTACIDVSGSMGGDASLKGDNGSVENTGLSYLDVVTHAVKTMIATLTEDDRLSLVSYNHQAELALEFTKMDTRGRQLAISALDALRPGGQTNIMDGLNTCLEINRTSGRSCCNSAIILFTDGIPNIVPPRGHGPTLQRYFDRYPEIKTQIHTCGFGYNLDSELLDELTRFTHGMYNFIPDSSMVGTVMVNLLSNIKAVGISDMKISLEFDTSTKITNNNRQLSKITKTSWGVEIDIGSINYGQKRDVVVVLDNFTGSLEMTSNYRNHQETSCFKIETKLDAVELKVTLSSEQELYFKEQIARLMVVNSLEKIINYMKLGQGVDAQRCLTQLKNHFIDGNGNGNSDSNGNCNDGDGNDDDGNNDNNDSHYLTNLQEDVDGQVTQSISRDDWFMKWGQHYLPSLLSAHSLQLTNNFKDPGVQHYAGPLFCDIRDMADDIFIKLPLPTPSNRVYPSRGGVSQSSIPVNMSSYHNSGGTCFAGHCQVSMFGSSKSGKSSKSKRVDHIKKGDKVRCGMGGSATVICVLKTLLRNNKTNLVLLEGGLLVTPWHPIRLEGSGKWQFPIQVGNCESFPCEAVYSFLLDSGHTMVISGVECICLAHGFNSSSGGEENEVVSHEYFGTDRVVDDLKQLYGWGDGLVVITPEYIKRGLSGNINSIKIPIYEV